MGEWEELGEEWEGLEEWEGHGKELLWEWEGLWGQWEEHTAGMWSDGRLASLACVA